MAEQGQDGRAQDALPAIQEPKVAVLAQPSFAGGEVAPGFHGRWDIDKFRVSMAEVKNFIVRPSGALARRPGFQYCGPTRRRYSPGDPLDQVVGLSRSRLVPFLFSSGDTFLLEFAALTISIWKDGARTHTETTNEWIDTPYTGTSTHTGNGRVFDLKFAQQGDVIYITHPEYAPYKLTRTGSGEDPTADWTMAAVSWTPTLSAPTSLALVQGNTTHDRRREWKYVVTAFDDDTGEESVASSALSLEIYLEAQKKNKRAKISWGAVSGADSYNVYRGRNDLYGFVGTSKTTHFFDDNIAPVYSIVPPSASNPFNTTDNYPACVAFYQQRLYFARSNSSPQTIWATMIGVYNQMLRSEPPNDDDAFEHILAARRMDEIRAIVPLNSLIVLTADSEWALNGPSGGAITPTAVEARPISFRGCSWLDPIVIGNRVLYVDRTGRSVRELVDDGNGSVSGDNALTVLASHLLEGRYIRSWCHQPNPDSIIWAVRDDGKLLSLTYLPEHEIWAWALHEIGNLGFGESGVSEAAVEFAFDDICCVREGNEDWVYATVTNWDFSSSTSGSSPYRWYIVRMKGFGQNVWDNPSLDFCLTDDNRTANALTDEVGLQAAGGTLGFQRGSRFEKGSGDNKVAGITNAGDVVVWEKDGEIVRWTGVDVAGTVYAECDRDIPLSMQYPRTGIKAYSTGTSWTLPQALPFGSSPFGNVYLNVCVDGVVERVLYSGGTSVTTSRKGVVAHFGLGYESSATTLPAIFPNGEGMGMRKRVSAVSVHGLSASKFNIQDADRRTTLSDMGVQARDPRWDAEIFGWDVAYLEGQEFIERYPIAGPWTNLGKVRVFVRETASGFPIQIMALAREVQLGG